MTGRPNIDALKALIEIAERKVGDVQDELALAAANLARVVGPLATAHRLAELAMEFDDIAQAEAD